MTIYGKMINQKQTPQTQPIFGMNQVKNNAGGYVFEASPKVILERFLTLGSEGGTFYVGEQKLTKANARTIIKLVQEDGFYVVETLKNFSDNNRAPKKDPQLFVLALLCTYGNPEVKQESYKAIKDVCNTSTHLFTFVANVQELRGWSRGLRRGVSDWYNKHSPKDLAYQLVKYRQRNGFSHQDVLRLSHPIPKDYPHSNLFSYAVGKESDVHTVYDIIKGYELAKAEKDSKVVAKLVSDYNLTWEMVPTEHLNNKEVLTALAEKMPMTATLRNLNRFTAAGLMDDRTSDFTRMIFDRIRSTENIKKGKVHPITLLNTLKVYSQGHGDKGKLVWNPNAKVIEALNDAFENSFDLVEPTNANILVGVDVSGSMTSPNVANMALSPREVAAALMLTMLRTEPNLEITFFDTEIKPVKAHRRTSYEEVIKNMPHGGGTDCSLPYQYASYRKLKLDSIVVLTDNESWAGKVHAVQAYQSYNPKIKNILVGMVANNYSIMPQNDPNTLSVAGFDSAVPKLINDFITGE